MAIWIKFFQFNNLLISNLFRRPWSSHKFRTIPSQSSPVTVQNFSLSRKFLDLPAKMELFATHLCKVRVPSTYDSVYKDECVYSFDSPVNCIPLQ